MTLQYVSGTTPDLIDSRDLIEWADYYRDDEDLDGEQRETLASIDSLADVGISDWEYGVCMVNDSYFTEYAQEFAEDLGAIPDNPAWPLYCIDWEWAARELQYDYTPVDFLGVTYWVR